ncbi:20782_t:CDS:2 [Cetraspora pellucida]|uniref:20782_t:CDS:1 n=1 Tax=Cetraspora pellucida TaxID=1433469 RepID=A0A9N9PA23_9GLOM|nr:20782_t:CDS:2 [Cetraspora pellucida]
MATEFLVNKKDTAIRSFNMNDEISIDDQLYIKDLTTIPKEGYLPESLIKLEPLVDSVWTFIVYLKDVFMHFFLMMVTNWTLPITQPFNFITIILIYFASVCFLLPATLFLSIGAIMGMEFNLYDEIGWQKLTTEDLKSIRDRGITALSKPVYTSRKPRFDLDLAEMLLFLSSVVYLREEIEIRKAVKYLSQIQDNLSKKENVEKADIEQVFHALDNADNGVRKIVDNWNIKFKSVSELSTSKGVYAGLFWSVEQNFIVVSFKGTSPTNFLELVVNFTFQRKDGRGFIFGGVHEGFYNCLFPKDHAGSILAKKGFPHLRIIEAINVKAKEIRSKNKKTEPVNIWITGHSLGASLATLFYARLLKLPNILSDDCVLRDVYSFAALAVGDSNFSSEFSSRYNESNSTLWRIVCEQDIAPHLPPHNNAMRALRQYLATNDIMNYFHVGDTVKFFHRKAKPRADQIIFDPPDDSIDTNQELTWNEWKLMFNEDTLNTNQPVKNNSSIYDQALLPYENLLRLPILSMLRNHIPHRYFAAMEKSRGHFRTNSLSSR